MPIVVFVAAAVMQAQPAPSSAWQAGLIENSCGVVRSYTSDAGPVLIELSRPGTIGQEQLRVVLPKAIDPGKRNEKLEMTIQPQGVHFVADHMTLISIGDGPMIERPDPGAVSETVDGRVVRKVGGLIAEPLAKAQMLELKIGEREPVRLDTGGAAEAMAALDQCRKTKIETAGLSESDLIPPHVAAEGNPGRWITHTDYPRDALTRREEGNVEIVYFIETDGRVKDCRALSNAPAILSRATCDLMSKRAQYKPARNAAGVPVRSLASRRVEWRLPR